MMERLFQRYTREHEAAGSSPKTIEFHKDGIGRFINWLKTKDISTDVSNLEADNVINWITEQREKKLSPHTIAKRIRSLKAFTNWLIQEEVIDKSPLKRLKPIKTDDTPKNILLPSDVDKILSSINRKTPNGKRDYAIILLLFSTGLRAAELINLRIEDIDYSKGLIVIRRGKGGKARTVPLGNKVERAINKYLNGRDNGPLFLTDEGYQVTYTTLRQILRRCEKRTGIHANPHLWRHSAAIQYLRSGGKIENLKALLGHSSLELTLYYARIAGIDLVTAHEEVDPTKALKSR